MEILDSLKDNLTDRQDNIKELMDDFLGAPETDTQEKLVKELQDYKNLIWRLQSVVTS